MSGELDLTPLDEWHRANGARMVDFAGWSMPVQYSSIVEEHRATRTAVGVFDISHMGRLRFDGPGAAIFLDHLLTRRVLGVEPGQIRYSLVTNEAGGILDDVLLYHLSDPDGSSYYLLVVNAGNRQKIVAWIEQHLAGTKDVRFVDQTLATAMIAVQGPHALEATQSLVAQPLTDLRYYQGTVTRIGDDTGVASRTGYTGEDGCELIVPAESAAAVWERILAASRSSGGSPAGLGARDTLRLEAAMPLYGHELSEEIDPYTAGLGFAVQNKDRQYIGQAALVARKQQTDLPRRIGLTFSARRVPRQHYKVFLQDELVGEVTSGTFSPTLERPIAMAYVRAAAAAIGGELSVDIRGRREPARVAELPFYRRPGAASVGTTTS